MTIMKTTQTTIRWIVLGVFGIVFYFDVGNLHAETVAWYRFEEGGGDGGFLLSPNSEFNHCATGMKWFEDFVFEVAGKDESAVAMKLLNKRP